MVRLVGKIFIRSLVVFFWLFIFGTFLFSPRFTELFRRKKSITIFSFPLLIDAQYISEFESRTGIKLHIHYYETNDELLTKLRTTKEHGYDIIFPSDYAVTQLIKEGHLQKLDHSKLPFINRINKKLLGLYYDPKSEYAMPYLWEVYGLGYNKESFGNGTPPAAWSLVFDEKLMPSHIGMLNNAREVISVAALYLFGTNKNLDDKKLEQIKELLSKQKERVSVYTDLRGDYLLLSQICSVIVCPAGDVWMTESPKIDFLLPREGSFISVDNVCIPATCTKTDLVYQFIDYLYEPEVVKHHSDTYFFFPAITMIPFVARAQAVMQKVLRNFSSFYFFDLDISEQKVSDVWISLKAV